MNFGVIRHKIWYDLWENKGRTLRVVAIIAIGAFAVGFTFGGREFILKDVARTWQDSKPATIGLEVSPPLNDQLLETLQHLPEVETVIGWQQAKIQWRATPADPWQSATLVALEDYTDQPIRQVKLVEGDWPKRKGIGIQSGRGLSVGDSIQFEINDKTYPVKLNGVLFNAALPPKFGHPDPMFFTTREYFAQLTGVSNYNLVLATIPDYSDDRAQAAADLMQHKLEQQNIEVAPAMTSPGEFKTRTSRPNQYIAQDVLDGVSTILSVLAVTILILGLFLVYNTINAMIMQQVNQIGMMKAIGAQFGQILGIYFVTVLIYAGLALLVALPLGILGAHLMRLVMVTMMGMIPGSFEISITAVIEQVVVALLSPLVAALIPIFAGARVTVQRAISNYGLGNASGLLERLLVKLQFIPSLISLTLSNTFRNKGRVVLTQITLAGAGVMFLMVMHTQASIVYTFSNVITSISAVNVLLNLENPERIEKIEALALTHPEVKAVEVWATARGTAWRRDQAESNNDQEVSLRGLPLPSATYAPQLRAGRWLQAGDEYQIVLNQELAEEMGVGVGDWLTLNIPTKRESNWQVVGMVYEPMDQNAASVPRETLLKEIRQVGRSKAIRVQTLRPDADSEAAIAADLRAMYEAHGYELLVSTTDTSHRLTAQWVERMTVILTLLSIMALMVVVVGVVALSGTLSLNVVERTREIGVMRAVGASALRVAALFIGEGLILGWLSWLIAIPLSIPAGQFLVKTLAGLINIRLVYQSSDTGFWAWLVIISILAVIASWFPAQKAVETSVRESLAYV